MDKVNIKKLKSMLTLSDYQKILKELGVPVVREDSEKIIYMTGCHNKNPQQGSPKLYFYKESRLFQCFTQCACTMDIISLVQKRLSLTDPANSSFIDAVNKIVEITGIDFETVKRISKAKYFYDWEESLGKYTRLKNKSSGLCEYDKDILYYFPQIYPEEWLEEGIGIDSLKKYQIRYYERTNQIIIPCLNREGKLIGIRIRNTKPDLLEQAKYMPLITLNSTCYKFNINNVFYGINYNWHTIESTGVVTLVEGEKSVLKADTWFNEHSNVLALYGSELGLNRRNQLLKMGVKHVNLALDSDFHELDDKDFEKFQKRIIKIARMFKGFCSVDVIYNNIGLEGYKCSPFDFDEETYHKLYENRENIF